MELKHPIKAKVYEAFGAIADQRVELIGNDQARITSSAGDRKYTVRWSTDRRRFTSNDNATRWQGTIGYPIIAVLLMLNEIALDRRIAAELAGVPWKRLNDQARRDYDSVIEKVLGEKNMDTRKRIEAEVDRIHDELTSLKIERLKQ